jgi:hypothetical protein
VSGGHYNYETLRIGLLADVIEEDCETLACDSRPDEWGNVRKAEPPEIIAAMRQCATDLRAVGERARAIEWYLSGDGSPESVLRS